MSQGYPVIGVDTDNARAVLFTSTGSQVGTGQREYSHSEIHDASSSQGFDSAANWPQVGRAAGIPQSTSSACTSSSVRPRRYAPRLDREEEELHA